MLIFPVWNRILKIWDTLFEIIQIEVQQNESRFLFTLKLAKVSKILEKYLWRKSAFSKVAGSKPANLLKMNSFRGIFEEFC